MKTPSPSLNRPRLRTAGRHERFCRMTAWFANRILSLSYELRPIGREHLPRNHAFILLAKHQCWQDIPLIALAARRPLYYIAKHELFRTRVSDWFMRSLGGIPLNRDHPLKSRDALRAMIHALRRGEGVVVFPEGTYYKGKMGPGKVGVLRLITSRLSLPLIPAGVQYTREAFRTRVHIRFGRPIYPAEKQHPNQMLHRVMTQIARLSQLK